MEIANNILIKCKNHANDQNKVFNDFFENGKFTDCVLVANSRIIRAHRVILAANSSYFNELLSSDKNDMNNVQIGIVKNIDYFDLCNILKFIYAGEIEVNFQYFNRFLKIVEKFGIQGILEYEAMEVVQNEPDIIIIKEEPGEVENFNINEPRVLIDQPSCSNVKNSETAIKQLNAIQNKRKIKSKPAAEGSTQNLIPAKIQRKETINLTIACLFCGQTFNTKKTQYNHQRYCTKNPNHLISMCNICNKEVKLGSMTAHKIKYHNHVTKKRRMTISC